MMFPQEGSLGRIPHFSLVGEELAHRSELLERVLSPPVRGCDKPRLLGTGPPGPWVGCCSAFCSLSVSGRMCQQKPSEESAVSKTKLLGKCSPPKKKEKKMGREWFKRKFQLFAHTGRTMHLHRARGHSFTWRITCWHPKRRPLYSQAFHLLTGQRFDGREQWCRNRNLQINGWWKFNARKL